MEKNEDGWFEQKVKEVMCVRMEETSLNREDGL